MTLFKRLFFATALFLQTNFSFAQTSNEPSSLFSGLESAFADYLVTPLATLLFFDVAFWTDAANVPFIVLWLMLGAVYLTFKMGFVNFRGFKHSILVTRGDYDNKHDAGDISHFQALSSALSATVGLGNIAGVAVAVGLGGPGAVFWMIVAGFFGMASKFTECTLAVMYRDKDKNNHMLGGPMRYLAKGFQEKGFAKTGTIFSLMFGIMCIGGSLGGGNMFQANQAFAAVAGAFPSLASYNWLFGIVMAVLVGVVIIGGIKRIGAAAGVIVPFMCLLYLAAGLWILLTNSAQIPSAFATILTQAFTPEASYGGIVGVIMMGFRRAAFSNEAGIGSSAIAHSAAQTNEPIREGLVALLEPFIDTIVICTMTGLVVVVTGVYTGEYGNGVLMTSAAFATVFPWFPVVLSLTVILFAFSTMISWSYYGERCWAYMFGESSSLVYKLIFCGAVFCGSVFSLNQVLEFSDLMVLGMAFPNMIGLIMFSGKVKAALNDYWARLKSGEMQPTYSRSDMVTTTNRI